MSLSGSPLAGSEPTPSCEVDRKGTVYNVITAVNLFILVSAAQSSPSNRIVPENVSQCQFLML